MTKLLIPLILIALVIGSAVVLSIWSRQVPVLGLQAGKLTACGPHPNCVCSESVDSSDSHFIDALTMADDNGERAWQLLAQAVTNTGGHIVHDAAGYMRVEYTTALMRFVDDVEFRLDQSQQRIHVRSASRVGHGDLGANRKRVEAIRREYASLQ